ncbi:hypothetical protein H6P81_020298 [Aristolochia fimbriata]|uniref:Uncharacterized protein n=1 Tax=Aristolochia fimbriata TaxID=158543 RepID=A0AAV7DYK1_ARIFI|nr:hypothetical protein H6P81_020298 [Aristolochia fimbriata]
MKTTTKYVVLASDSDFAGVVDHAMTSWMEVCGPSGLNRTWSGCVEGYDSPFLFRDYSADGSQKNHGGSTSTEFAPRDAWDAAYRGVAAGAALVAGLDIRAYLRRSGL